MRDDEIKALDDKQLAVFIRGQVNDLNAAITIAEERGLTVPQEIEEVGIPGKYKKRLSIGLLTRSF